MRQRSLPAKELSDRLAKFVGKRTLTSNVMNFNSRKTVQNRRSRNGKILVIEDNADHWVFIQNAMQQCFREVEPVWVNNGAEALTYLEECSDTGGALPQLLLLDLYVPNREDGWNILQEVKNRPGPIGRLPVVLFSSSADFDDVMESYRRGVNSYVVKPVSFDEWLNYFKTLKDYWWEAVSLPATNCFY